MKKVVSIVTGIVGILSLMAFMPAVSHASGSIVKLIPSESRPADATGFRFEAGPSKHYMDVAESQAVETGGPRSLMPPSKHYKDVAESQEVDASIDTPRVAAKTPWNFWEKSN